MSAKTKIVVLRIKELIYTGLFVALGILLIVLLIILFLPGKDRGDALPDTETPQSSDAVPNATPGTEVPTLADAPLSAVNNYIPGIYTTELLLNGQAIDVEVVVNQASVTSVRFSDLSEEASAMYPLLEPALENICRQLYETQSLENITYEPESKYTSLVLLEAIRSSLSKAQGELSP